MVTALDQDFKVDIPTILRKNVLTRRRGEKTHRNSKRPEIQSYQRSSPARKYAIRNSSSTRFLYPAGDGATFNSLIFPGSFPGGQSYSLHT